MQAEKVTAVIQARTGSTRLLGKVFARISGRPLLYHVVSRLRLAKKIDKIVLATTTNPADNRIVSWCQRNRVEFFRGSEKNLLSRYYEAALMFSATHILRVTADDPFKDPAIIDKVVTMYFKHELDFAYNNYPPTFPEGLDVEVFSVKALEKAHKLAKKEFEREHPTQYFYRNPAMFKQKNLRNSSDLSDLRWTIDTDKDLVMARAVYRHLYKDKGIFLMGDILKLLLSRPHIRYINSNVPRSAMYKR